jgi:Ca2+:H+ antiporter
MATASPPPQTLSPPQSSPSPTLSPTPEKQDSRKQQQQQQTTPTTPSTHNGLLTPLPMHSARADTGLSRELTPVERIQRFLAVRAAGDAGRSGVHPVKFLRNVFRSASWASRVVNVLWPVVPAAIAVRYAMPDNYLVIFILSYLAMVPCANLIGFAGQELSRKFPHVLGVIVETT